MTYTPAATNVWLESILDKLTNPNPAKNKGKIHTALLLRYDVPSYGSICKIDSSSTNQAYSRLPQTACPAAGTEQTCPCLSGSIFSTLLQDPALQMELVEKQWHKSLQITSLLSCRLPSVLLGSSICKFMFVKSFQWPGKQKPNKRHHLLPSFSKW